MFIARLYIFIGLVVHMLCATFVAIVDREKIKEYFRSMWAIADSLISVLVWPRTVLVIAWMILDYIFAPKGP